VKCPRCGMEIGYLLHREVVVKESYTIPLKGRLGNGYYLVDAHLAEESNGDDEYICPECLMTIAKTYRDAEKILGVEE